MSYSLDTQKDMLLAVQRKWLAHLLWVRYKGARLVAHCALVPVVLLELAPM